MTSDGQSCYSSKLTLEDVATLIEQSSATHEPINLERANLSGLELTGLDLSRANLRNANISNVDFSRSKLVEADLRGADARGAIFYEDTRLAGALICGIKLDSNSSLPAYAFRYSKETPRYVGDLKRAQKTKSIEDYHHARRAMLTLKLHLQETGRYIEASWAHQVEQRIVRALINPFNRLRWRKHGEVTLIPKEFVGFIVKWLVSWVSDLICGYGEDVARTLVSILIIQAIFTGYYWITGSVVNAPFGQTGTTVTNIFDVILFSVAAMTTTGVQGLYPATHFVEFVMSFQVLVGITLTGLLGFVLGNRIRYSS